MKSTLDDEADPARRIFSSLDSLRAPADFEQVVGTRVLFQYLPLLNAPPSFEADVLKRVSHAAEHPEPEHTDSNSTEQKPSIDPITEPSVPQVVGAGGAALIGTESSISTLAKFGIAAAIALVACIGIWSLQTARQKMDISTIQQAHQPSNEQAAQPTRQQSEAPSQTIPNQNQVQASQHPASDQSSPPSSLHSLRSAAHSAAAQSKVKQDSTKAIDAVRGAHIPKERQDEE